MTVSVEFGVKTDDIEEARSWVESVSGLKAEPRESEMFGGDYYKFESGNGDVIKLITNRDPKDNDPIFGESEEWEIALRIEAATSESELLGALIADTHHFTSLENVK